MPKNFKLLIWFLIALAIAMAPWIVLAQESTVLNKHIYNIDKVRENGIGYAQAVKVGNTLYISGTVGGGEMKSAIKSVYDQLQKTLAAYGIAFDHVVKENVFTTDLKGFIENLEIRKKYYKKDYPAASWVEVRRLYTPDLTVEVELIAEI